MFIRGACAVAVVALVVVPAAMSSSRVTAGGITLDRSTVSATMSFTQSGLVPGSTHGYRFTAVTRTTFIGPWYVARLVNAASTTGEGQYCAVTRNHWSGYAPAFFSFDATADASGVVTFSRTFSLPRASDASLRLYSLAVADPVLTMDGSRVGRAVLHVMRSGDPAVFDGGPRPNETPPCPSLQSSNP